MKIFKTRGIRLCALGICLLASGLSKAQKSDSYEAIQHIRELKKGVLLVRVQNRLLSLEKLIEAGNEKQAEMLKKNIEAENKTYAKAFKKNFDFCPVYFFSSDESEGVVQGAWDKITYLDFDLRETNKISFEGKKVYTAEFAIIEVDNLDGAQRMNAQEAGEYESEEVSYKSSDMGFHALVIKDQEFNQLKRPFPFFTKTLKSLPFQRRPEKVVSIMNEKLHRFHEKNR